MTITANTATVAVGVAATVAMVAQAAPARADSPVNVAVTDSVRSELVAAAVAMTNGVPASEFSGLQPARTYLDYECQLPSWLMTKHRPVVVVNKTSCTAVPDVRGRCHC